MSLTLKNHYNPCFWVAYWNKEYLDSKRNFKEIDLNPRDVLIYSLNIKADKIITHKTENSFFEKKYGLVQASNDQYLEFLKKNPKLGCVDSDENDVFINFEPIFSELENEYKATLEKVIINRKIESLEEKVYLSFFIFFQTIRNHSFYSKVIKDFNTSNEVKLDFLSDMKSNISNKETLLNCLEPLISSKWSLYNLNKVSIPISDNPILLLNSRIYLPISPDLLLEISLKNKVYENQICSNNSRLFILKYKKILNQIVKNSKREIVSGDEKILEKIKNSDMYKLCLKK